MLPITSPPNMLILHELGYPLGVDNWDNWVNRRQHALPVLGPEVSVPSHHLVGAMTDPGPDDVGWRILFDEERHPTMTESVHPAPDHTQPVQ